MELFGSPGRKDGLMLRVGQCLFAAASIGVMACITAFTTTTACCYVIALMGLKVVWSFALACLDIHALTSNKDLYNHVIVSLFVVGDLVTATLSLAAACSSAGVIVLFERDTNICRVETKFACYMFQISIAFAFASWFLVAISSCIMFWLVASILLFRPSFVSIAPTLCTYCSFFSTI